jgi:hypothetical protein
MESSVRLREALATLAVLGVVGCGSPPPGSVDEEIEAVDLRACLRNDPICIKSGGFVGPAEILLPEGEAVFLGVGAKFSLPLKFPEKARRLSYLAIGSAVAPRVTEGEFKEPEGTPRRELVVTVRGATDARSFTVTTVPGYKRLEIDFADWVPPPDARLEVETAPGFWSIVWIVGRWRE